MVPKILKAVLILYFKVEELLGLKGPLTRVTLLSQLESRILYISIARHRCVVYSAALEFSSLITSIEWSVASTNRKAQG